MTILPPSLSELTARRVSSLPQDTGSDDAIVEPHDAGGGFRTDTKTAFADAAVVVKLLTGDAPTTPPGGWDAYVRSRPSQSAVVMRVGNFPQLCDFKTQLSTVSATPFAAVERDMVATITSKLTGEDRSRHSTDLEMNEAAATLLDQGQVSEAAALWQTLTVAGIRDFNLGIVALLRNDPKTAADCFTRSAGNLPPASGWVELALAYRAGCETPE